MAYLAQEFYLEYGGFDYAVTAPSDMLVAGSGELLNPGEVLTAAQRARLAEARGSDRTVTIRSPEEAAERVRAGGARTWHFAMKNTRDVAWSASSTFAWDAARINLPGGRTALAQSFYPPESAGPARWGRSTEYLKDAVERFSARWYPYPYPNAINVAGPAAGSKYSGIVFDGIDNAGKALFWISAHEIGHSWFPMIGGFDERRDAWMDEGFNALIDTYESDEFEGGVYGPKRDREFAPGGGNPVDEILPLLADQNAPPILSRSDTVSEKYRHPVTYFKSALGLTLLREEILGPERFDPAFRRFIAAWAFKRPKPADFLRAMEARRARTLAGGGAAGTRRTGRWTWRWSISTRGRGRAAGAGRGARQADDASDAAVTYADRTTRDLRLPAETFIRPPVTLIPVPAADVVRAELDPDHRTPDRDRSDNVAVARSID